MMLKSRYADQPAVSKDPAALPERFRGLLALATIWAIGDDVERSDFMAQATPEEKKRLVDAVSPHFDALHAWSVVENQRIPVPDEVILLDMLALAAAEALLEVYPAANNQPPQPPAGTPGRW